MRSRVALTKLLILLVLVSVFAFEDLRELDNDHLGFKFENMSNFAASYPNSLQHPELASTKDFHGTEIVDKFAWLEDPHADDVKAWVDAQNLVTESYLKQLDFKPKMTARYVLPFPYIVHLLST